LQSSGVVFVNRRSYQSISDTLGNIGGITQLVFVVMLLLYKPINESQRKSFILKKIYPLLGEKDIKLGSK